MGKRQIIIKKQDILQKISEILGKELNLVLKNDVTLYGKILSIDNETVKFRDLIRRRHTFLLKEIAELILDIESDY